VWSSSGQFDQDIAFNTSSEVPVMRISFMAVGRMYPNVTLMKY
jgi:hypothetical protein